MNLEYITDSSGSPCAVVMPIADWKNMEMMLYANKSASYSSPLQTISTELSDEMLKRRQEYLRSRRGVRRTEWGQHADSYIREMRDNDRI